jgi:diguanylate cyclase (GGDEF)-like protein
MKKQSDFETSGAAAQTATGDLPSVLDKPACLDTHRQQGCAEISELRVSLTAMTQQLQAAREQNASLLAIEAQQRKKLQRLAKKCQQTLHVAYHDELTGLPNRSLLLDRLKQAMARAARQQSQVALLFIDLDKFKQVNDSLGHAMGDALLQQAANRLKACVRLGDTACRYGGDEFVVMLPDIDNQDTVTAVMEKVRVALDAPYDLQGTPIKITASIGIASYRADGQSYKELIMAADNAMYLAKAHHHGTS